MFQKRRKKKALNEKYLITIQEVEKEIRSRKIIKKDFAMIRVPIEILNKVIKYLEEKDYEVGIKWLSYPDESLCVVCVSWKNEKWRWEWNV